MNKGGFLSPNKNDILNNSKFTNASNGEKKPFSQTITPLTIKMLKDAINVCSDDNLMFEEHKIDQVVICARILEIQDENSRKMISISDESEELKCIVYYKGSSDLPAYYTNCNPCEKMYVKVVLSITNYQDKKIFVCQRMDEIKNFNEYVNHILNVMSRILARRNPGFENDEKENLTSFQGKLKQQEPPKNPQNLEKMIGSVLNQGISEDEKIYEVIKLICKENGGQGASSDQIMKMTQSKIDSRKTKVILNKLLQDGYVYSMGDKFNVYE